MRHFITLSVLFILLSSVLTVDGAEKFPLIPKVNEKIAVDGALSESSWDKATLCKLDNLVMGSASIEPATVKLLSDDKNIYIGAIIEESNPKGPGMNDFATNGNSRNYGIRQAGSDYLGVILDVGKDGFSAYLSIFVNALGEHCVYGTWPQHASSNFTGLQFPNSISSAAKVNLKDKNWTLELVIPWGDVLKYPLQGIPKHIAMNFRRTQWGDDLQGRKPTTSWNYSVDRSAKLMRQHYEHMVSWQPMLSAPIWVKNGFDIFFQYPYPNEVGVFEVEGASLDNKVITGDTHKVEALYQTSWMKVKHPGWEEKPRLLRWGDVRPTSFPDIDTKALILSKPRPAHSNLEFATKPTVTASDEKVSVKFALTKPSDVLVSVLDKNGKVVRVLGHGLLGDNAPVPFKKGSLSQTLEWDYKDAAGNEVPKGSYHIEVSAGLKTSTKRILDMKLDKSGKPSWPALLDVESMPKANPDSAKMKKHDHGGGGGNHLAIDFDKNQVWLPGYKIYDIESGKLVRDFKFRHNYPSGLVRSGEVEIHNGNLYVAGWNELWKTDENGKAIAWHDLGKPFIANLFGGHSNPRRGLAVGPDGSVYIIHHRMAHGNTHSDVSRISPGGKILEYGLVNLRLTTTTGVHVDSRGNIYVGTPVKPQLQTLPDEVGGQLNEASFKIYGAVYGSIAKFTPAGGKLEWNNAAKKLNAPKNQNGIGLESCELKGAEWVLPGLSPTLPRARGKSNIKCPCRRGDFDIDQLDRIYMPDAIMGRVHIADPAGNVIATVGKRGNNIDKMELRWPTYVIANKDYLFIADFLHEKCVQLNLDYQINASEKITKKKNPAKGDDAELKAAPVNLKFPTFEKLGSTNHNNLNIPKDLTPKEPLKVNVGKVVFDDGFDSNLDNWQVERWEEGDAVKVHIKDGQMQVDTKSMKHGTMVWCKKELPDDFRFEFDFTPLSDDGFFLIFFCYKGNDGKSVLEKPHWGNQKYPSLFKKYTKGHSRGYHISYRRGNVADCNFRKNPGQRLMKKSVLDAKLTKGKKVHVALTKKNGRSVLTVDGKLFMDYLDGQKHYDGGVIGLRQVYNSSGLYDNIKISEVK